MPFGRNDPHAKKEAGYCGGSAWGKCAKFGAMMAILDKMAPKPKEGAPREALPPFDLVTNTDIQ